MDFGEFYCGVVDLTNPEAFEWFKDIIKEYTLGIGIDGWMADFGEYLPTDDICLYSGKSPMIEHNHWPVLWAKCNYEAVKESESLEMWFTSCVPEVPEARNTAHCCGPAISLLTLQYMMDSHLLSAEHLVQE